MRSKGQAFDVKLTMHSEIYRGERVEIQIEFQPLKKDSSTKKMKGSDMGPRKLICNSMKGLAIRWIFI